MLQQVSSGSPYATRSRTGWRKFSATAPSLYEMVEIRRLHDDKTILRRRIDLPPSFDWRHAEWRPF